jgi:hypothetical protein
MVFLDVGVGDEALGGVLGFGPPQVRAATVERRASAATSRRWSVLQAVALFGPGVGRVQQRHAPFSPQRLHLI